MELQLKDLIVFIDVETGMSLVNKNIQINLDFKEGLEVILDEIQENIDINGLSECLKDIMRKITNQNDKPKADLMLAKKIMDYLGEIDIKTAASSDFWNGLALCNEEIFNFITWRWKNYEKYKFFRRATPIDKRKHSERIKRYITSSYVSAIRKQTLARIWWAVKLFSVENQDLLWKQQDTVDRILENSFGALDKDGTINDLISVFLKKYKEKDDEGKFNFKREAKLRNIISWLKLYENLIFIDNLETEVIEYNIDQIFESIIIQYDKPKTRKTPTKKKAILEPKKSEIKYKIKRSEKKPDEPELILQKRLPILKTAGGQLKPEKIQVTFMMSEERIKEALSEKWISLKQIIKKLHIKDMLDVRWIQIKMRDLERRGIVEVQLIDLKKHWKLK